jgi:hypothetical protein
MDGSKCTSLSLVGGLKSVAILSGTVVKKVFAIVSGSDLKDFDEK